MEDEIGALLLRFDREAEVAPKDFLEKVSDFGLGLLRFGCGRAVRVHVLNGERIFSEEERPPLWARIAVIALAIVLWPLIGVGALACAFSSSHYQMALSMKKSRPQVDVHPPTPAVRQDDNLAASEHNATILLTNRERFPKEIRAHILDFLDSPSDLMCAGLTSQAFASAITPTCVDRTAHARRELQLIMECATLFNEIITEKTNRNWSLIQDDTIPNLLIAYYRFFRFDMNKYKTLIEKMKINPHPTLACNAEKVVQECRLDLIEALSEYNIESELIEESFAEGGITGRVDRFIDKIDLTPYCETKPALQELAQEILAEAKNTLKGDLFLINLTNYLYATSGDVLLEGEGNTLPSSDIRIGPYAEVWMTGPENDNWRSHFYYRQRAIKSYVNPSGDYIHFDHLIGKREGDRLVVENTRGGERVILRCRQQSYRYRGKNFETVLANHTCHIQGDLWFLSDEEKQVLPQIQQKLDQMKEKLNQIGSKRASA